MVLVRLARFCCAFHITYSEWPRTSIGFNMLARVCCMLWVISRKYSRSILVVKRRSLPVGTVLLLGCCLTV